MDGREGMALSGSSSYYLNRGVSGSGTNPVSGTHTGLTIPTPPGFKTQPNTNISPQSNVRVVSSVGSSFQVENPSPNYPHGFSMGMASVVIPGESGKKKRGRPRKYGPGGANMALALSPASKDASGGSTTPTEKKNRGRPPGSGRKQRLAELGEWMNSSAGTAFTPHIIHVSAGEDVAAKILSFAQQRPRALCILSANGSVSVVTLRQPTTSGGTVTFEGRFEILCFSGSYLLSETGSPQNRTGGLSISVCSPDGQVLGGAIGGRLIAASVVQVVVCSFVYGGVPKTKTKSEEASKDERSSVLQIDEKPYIPTAASDAPSQNLSLNPGVVSWPPDSRPSLRNPHSDIDLTRG